MKNAKSFMNYYTKNFKTGYLIVKPFLNKQNRFKTLSQIIKDFYLVFFG